MLDVKVKKKILAVAMNLSQAACYMFLYFQV